MSPAEKVVAGVDLGGTAINYTFLDERGLFLIAGLCEHPARSVEGPNICIGQIAEGLELACRTAGVDRRKLIAVGLDTPGPASADGVLSKRGSTNFVHSAWAGYDIRAGLESTLGLPVTYLNDGNAAALWGHASLFGSENTSTSVSAIIGTGLGGGVITDGRVVSGRNGFGGELGHVLIPYAAIPGIEGLTPDCNCGRTGDLESLCSLTAIRRTLLPHFLAKQPDHPLAAIADMNKRFPKLELILVESGGDNLAATFSPELADLTIYVIDVSGGEKIPRKGGPGITRSDLLVINKIDLAPYVGASLEVMARDAKLMRKDRPFVFTNMKTGEGVEEIIAFIEAKGGLSRGA